MHIVFDMQPSEVSDIVTVVVAVTVRSNSHYEGSRTRFALSISKKVATSTTVSVDHAGSLKHGGLEYSNHIKSSLVT